MSLPRRPSDLFGIPTGLEREAAERLLVALTDAWMGLGAAVPRQVDEAVDWLFKQYFDPLARGARLRKALESIQAQRRDAPFLTEQLVMDLGNGRGLITPEGRVAMWALQESIRPTGSTVVLRDDTILAAESFLLDRYRGYGRARLEQVVRLGKGTGNPMLPAAAAIPLLLLVNRSTSPERSLRRPTQADQRQELDQAVGKIVAAFAEVIDESTSRRHRGRSADHMSLYGGYPLTEARRRLGAQLSEDPGDLFVRPGQQDAVLRFVASDLARRRLPPEQIAQAYDALLATYRAQIPILTALRISFERPADSNALRAQLLNEYREACPAC
ncbi:MAG: hypothetical protein AABM41_01150 [Chloroflexota bacterium]